MVTVNMGTDKTTGCKISNKSSVRGKNSLELEYNTLTDTLFLNMCMGDLKSEA